MDTLGAVNLILRKIGEIPVTSIDEQYPTLTVALPALEEARIATLSEGYWFNTFYDITLAPNVAGEVRCPPDTLKFFPTDGRFAFMGSHIRDAATGNPFVGEPVQGRLILDIPFEELPEVARYAIAYAAAFDTYMGDIGPDATSQDLAAKRDSYLEQLNGDHTVSRKKNSRKRKQVQRWYQSLRSS